MSNSWKVPACELQRQLSIKLSKTSGLSPNFSDKTSFLWYNINKPQLVSQQQQLLGYFALMLYDALAQSKIQPIMMTHEPCVGFAAHAYSRIRGSSISRETSEKSLKFIDSGSPDQGDKEQFTLDWA